LPPLLDRLSSKNPEANREHNGNGVGQKQRDEHYIDPDGYWIDSERKFPRMVGEQVMIVKKDCGLLASEWKLVCDALDIGDLIGMQNAVYARWALIICFR